MKLSWLLFMASLLSLGCYCRWDVPKVPRTDPCTGKRSVHYVYLATCEAPPPPVPQQ